MPNVENNNGKTFVAGKLAQSPLEGWLCRFYRQVSLRRLESLPDWAVEHLRDAPAVTLNARGEATSWSDPALSVVVSVERRNALQPSASAAK
jgi:hypothetical protein